MEMNCCTCLALKFDGVDYVCDKLHFVIDKWDELELECEEWELPDGE